MHIALKQKFSTAETGAQMRRYLVGALIALALDYLVVWFSMAVGVHPWIARILGLVVGISTTYAFNRRFTFAAQTEASFREWARYASTQLIGSVLNFSVSALGLYWGDDSAAQIALAIGAGAAAGFSYNFFAARLVLSQDSGDSQ